MLQNLRERLVLVLFGLLPFHAFLVTVGTKMLVGPGHPPLTVLALWKELLIAALFLIGFIELFSKRKFPKIDGVTSLILALLLLSIIISATQLQSLLNYSHYIFGFKYLFLPLLVFLLCKALPWEEQFLERKVFPLLLYTSGIVAAYGIVSFFLPQGFFTALGYSDAHSLYSPDAPLSAFQQISGTGIRRIQSMFAGPNQLGLWLLIPWSISLVSLLRKNPKPPSTGLRTSSIRNPKQIRNSNFVLRACFEFCASCFVLGLVAIALFLTFSRSAWLAALIILLVSVSLTLRGSMRKNVLAGLFFTVIFGMMALLFSAPQLFYRGLGNEQHLARAREGFLVMLQEPLGRGLGAAGPASNRVSDACVYFPDGADTSWAREREDLCIFVGGEQVQPFLTERKCGCAFLPENWYLQVGVELGVIGFTLFIALVVSVIRLLVYSFTRSSFQTLPVFLVFLGISIAALFLHAWEDSAVAYTVWGLAGISLVKKEGGSWFHQVFRRFFG